MCHLSVLHCYEQDPLGLALACHIKANSHIWIICKSGFFSQSEQLDSILSAHFEKWPWKCVGARGDCSACTHVSMRDRVNSLIGASGFHNANGR